MDLNLLEKRSNHEWRIAPHGAMRVPGVIYADEALVRAMDHKVYEQICNVAMLQGIVGASYAMPDAHWGYGFPIGGVAAFDAAEGGMVSAGGVGFDVSCGVRALTTGLKRDELETCKSALADRLFTAIPAGLGSHGSIILDEEQMAAMLAGGARWAVESGYGVERDLERIEEHGAMPGAQALAISNRAKERQRREMGALGSGNHYLKVQEVAEIFAPAAAAVFGLRQGDIIVSIHCGSRGLGHQIGTDFLKEMALVAPKAGIRLPDRELACALIDSELGRRYLGGMRGAINCALANRQILTHLTRRVFAEFFPAAELELFYDVSHNTCKVEKHMAGDRSRDLYVHRKGATRACGPGHPELPAAFKSAGQPVLIGGSMGTASYVLAGTTEGESKSWSSACHGAGRALSRRQASKRWQGRKVVDDLAGRGILIRSPSLRGVAEEAPGAYKDVSAVVNAADRAGLARKVARLSPVICIKG